MKRSIVAIEAMLLICPALSMASEQAGFEGGLDEVVVALNAPSFEATVDLDVPAGYYVTNATMKVTGMAAEGNASAYPEEIIVSINGSPIWGFMKNGFGPMGRKENGNGSSFLQFRSP